MATYMRVIQDYNRKYWHRRYPLRSRLLYVASILAPALCLSLWTETTTTTTTCPSCTECPIISSAPKTECIACPVAPVSPSTMPTIHDVLGFTINSCLDENGNDTYCYVESETSSIPPLYSRIWQQPSKNADYTVLFHRHINSATTVTQRQYFVDYDGDYYFESLATMDNRVTAPLLIKERHLRHVLGLRDKRHQIGGDIDHQIVTGSDTTIDNDDNNGDECVCPDTLGLNDNISFLHYHDVRTNKRQWIVMLDPALVNTPTVPGTRRLKTTIPRRSAGGVNMHYETVEHADQLLVSFSEPLFKFGEHVASHDRLRLMEYNQLLEKERKNFIVLRRIDAESQHLARVSVTLSGQAAQCFIYCQHPSRLVPVAADPYRL